MQLNIAVFYFYAVGITSSASHKLGTKLLATCVACDKPTWSFYVKLSRISSLWTVEDAGPYNVINVFCAVMRFAN